MKSKRVQTIQAVRKTKWKLKVYTCTHVKERGKTRFGHNSNCYSTIHIYIKYLNQRNLNEFCHTDKSYEQPEHTHSPTYTSSLNTSALTLARLPHLDRAKIKHLAYISYFTF